MITIEQVRKINPSLNGLSDKELGKAILELAGLRNLALGKGVQIVAQQEESMTFAALVAKFPDYVQYDLGHAQETAAKYHQSLKRFMKDMPEVATPAQLSLDDITKLKKIMSERGVKENGTNSVIFALRTFLSYCQKIHKIVTINPKDIRPMKPSKRQVIFLAKEEINQLLNSINTDSHYGLRMRALMELLIASGMRISEALSLNRDSISWETNEAMIIGKGNKQRDIFITERAAEWLKKYLAGRTDSNPALFVTFGTVERLNRHDLGKEFRRYAVKAGLKKKVTPHILRHSMATLMLHNGVDITYIKDLLGHSSIETTAQYYLGTDKKALKEAHSKYLKFD